MLLAILLIIPLFGAFILSGFGKKPYAGLINAFFCLLTFLIALVIILACQHFPYFSVHQLLFVDDFSAYLIILSTFIAFTTALFSITYMRNELLQQKLTTQNIRVFYCSYQLFLFTMLLVLTSNNLGILWVAIEGATLATVLLVSLYRSPKSLESAWKYLVLCGVGIAQALLGTILLYFAGEKVLGDHQSLLITHLQVVSHFLSPRIASIAFIFILVGYGTKAGFVPLHNWLPDAYGEAPAPVSALLSALLSNIAIYAIIRYQTIVAGATGFQFTHRLLIAFGLISIVIASFFLLRQKEIKRLYAYSSIEHVGLITFAFGLGTPLAMFAALLHMAMHGLTKSAAFFSAGQAIQCRKTNLINHIKGLINDYPALGWGMMFSCFALIGLPPFGTFVSEFLIIWNTVVIQPWLTPILIIALLIAFAAIFHKAQNMIFGEPLSTNESLQTISTIPLYLHLLLVLILGISIPLFLWHDFSEITKLLQGII